MGGRVFMLDAALRSILWEECKGKLRAMAAFQGSYQVDRGSPSSWASLNKRVEAFIKSVEDEGLHE